MLSAPQPRNSHKVQTMVAHWLAFLELKCVRRCHTPSSSGERFAVCARAGTVHSSGIHRNQNVYQLRTLSEPRSCIGCFRKVARFHAMPQL